MTQQFVAGRNSVPLRLMNPPPLPPDRQLLLDHELRDARRRAMEVLSDSPLPPPETKPKVEEFDTSFLDEPERDLDLVHGKRNTYVNLGCRCSDCRQANTDYQNMRYEPLRAKPKKHGTEGCYTSGCRCDECRMASTKARRRRRRSPKAPAKS